MKTQDEPKVEHDDVAAWNDMVSRVLRWQEADIRSRDSVTHWAANQQAERTARHELRAWRPPDGSKTVYEPLKWLPHVGADHPAAGATALKALTICQPYAHLVAIGAKPIENRSWPTAYRGPLAIHAGKSRAWLDEDSEAECPGMVFGAVVAIATLYDCVRLANLPDLLAGHQHAHGPWCWLLRDIVRLPQPLTVRGAQGLWELPPLAARELTTLIGGT